MITRDPGRRDVIRPVVFAAADRLLTVDEGRCLPAARRLIADGPDLFGFDRRRLRAKYRPLVPTAVG